MGFPGGSEGKESACRCWRASRLGKNWWQLVAARVPVTMRSLRLLRIPFLCGLLWDFCAPGARAEEPGASSSHHGSMGLDKNTVHDQEYVFSQGCGPGASPSAAAASCKGTRCPLCLLLFVQPLDIFPSMVFIPCSHL